MTVSHQLRNSRLRLLAGWWVLLLYLGAFSPLGMGGAVLLGWLDADHEVTLQAGADQVRVVLHHHGNPTTHRHGAVAWALTSFARPVSDTEPDHVLQFSSGNSLTRASQLVMPAANESAPVPVVFTEPDVRVVAKTNQFISPPRPPPDIVGNILNSRSTVLLI